MAWGITRMHSKEKGVGKPGERESQQVVTEQEVDPAESRCAITLRVRDRSVSTPSADDSN